MDLGRLPVVVVGVVVDVAHSAVFGGGDEGKRIPVGLVVVGCVAGAITEQPGKGVPGFVIVGGGWKDEDADDERDEDSGEGC